MGGCVPSCEVVNKQYVSVSYSEMMEHVSSDFIQRCLPPFYIVGGDQCVSGEWRETELFRGVEWSIFGVFRVFGGFYIGK